MSLIKCFVVTYLDLGVLKDIAEVLGDSVFRSQILLSKVHGLFVGKDGRGIRAEELLLDTHVVIGDSQDCCAVLRRLRRQILFVLSEGGRVKPLSQHHLLKQNDGTHGVIKSQFVLVKLRENCTDVQMSVSLDLWALEPRFNSKSSLQEVKSSAHFANPTIVAGHVVEGHSLTKLVVFTELF